MENTKAAVSLIPYDRTSKCWPESFTALCFSISSTATGDSNWHLLYQPVRKTIACPEKNTSSKWEGVLMNSSFRTEDLLVGEARVIKTDIWSCFCFPIFWRGFISLYGPLVFVLFCGFNKKFQTFVLYGPNFCWIIYNKRSKSLT